MTRPAPTARADAHSSAAARRRRNLSTAVIVLIYLVSFVFFGCKMLFYTRYVGRFPDELQHISYIAYLEAHPHEIVPQFKNMQVLAIKDSSVPAVNHLTAVNGMGGTYTLSGGFNYLCHPPLYYHIMRLAGGVKQAADGTFQIDLVQLRLFSMAIAVCGLLLFFYIGYSRISRRPLLHLLYATICISVPMFAYVSAGVNNDTLTLPAMGLTALGMLRLSEKKWTYGTYVLIGSGVALAILTKYTAGIMVILLVAVGALAVMVREKSLRPVLRREFLPSLPFYLAVALYAAVVYHQTGSFQPDYRRLRPQEFMASGFYVEVGKRAVLTFHQYVIWYCSNFFHTWTDITSATSLYKNVPLYARQRIGIFAVAILPLALFLPWRIRKKRYPSLSVLRAAYFSMAFTALVQMLRGYYQFRYVSGYLGAYQSRYYLCGIVWLGLGIVWLTGRLMGPGIRVPDTAGRRPGAALRAVRRVRHASAGFICVVFSALLTYEDFFFFIRNYKDVLK